MAKRPIGFNDNGDNDTLIYPMDMTSDFYPEAIKFSIVERQGVSYQALKKKTIDQTEKIVSAVRKGDTSFLGNLFEVASSVVKGVIAPSKEIQEATSAAVANNDTTQRTTSAGNGTQVPNGGTSTGGSKNVVTKATEIHIQNIYLNMPSSVVFSEGVEWQGADMGILGAAKAGGLSGAVEYGIVSKAGALVGGAAGAVAALLPGVGGIASTIIGTTLGEGLLQGAGEATFGIKANPYKEQTFQGVGFRPFDFTFVFRARSQADVMMIQKIITSFRRHSKPTFSGGPTSSGVFAYPKEFIIEYLTIDKNNSYQLNKYLPNIKNCICTNVTTNFTGAGWKSFEDGAPVDISLQVTFQETDIVTGEDVKEGF